jgi:hypothetical protein
MDRTSTTRGEGEGRPFTGAPAKSQHQRTSGREATNRKWRRMITSSPAAAEAAVPTLRPPPHPRTRRARCSGSQRRTATATRLSRPFCLRTARSTTRTPWWSGQQSGADPSSPDPARDVMLEGPLCETHTHTQRLPPSHLQISVFKAQREHRNDSCGVVGARPRCVPVVTILAKPEALGLGPVRLRQNRVP